MIGPLENPILSGIVMAFIGVAVFGVLAIGGVVAGEVIERSNHRVYILFTISYLLLGGITYALGVQLEIVLMEVALTLIGGVLGIWLLGTILYWGVQILKWGYVEPDAETQHKNGR